MKARQIETIDISTGWPLYRFKKYWLDRFRADGTKSATVTIDDESGIITITPGDGK